jgi:hypothetical protein
VPAMCTCELHVSKSQTLELRDRALEMRWVERWSLHLAGARALRSLGCSKFVWRGRWLQRSITVLFPTQISRLSRRFQAGQEFDVASRTGDA